MPGMADESWTEMFVRVLGYCWVVVWFCFTWPMWQDGYSVNGNINPDRGPISQFVLDANNRWTSGVA